MMILFNHSFPSIDMCVLHYLSGSRYKYKFINFYLKHKPCFPPKFHDIFKRYMILYLSCETVDLNGVTDLIRVLHNNMQSVNIHCKKPFSKTVNKQIYESKNEDTGSKTPKMYLESKYQTKTQLISGLSTKLKHSIPYKFTKSPILIEQHYPNSNKELLSFVLTCINYKQDMSLVENFIDNFIQQLMDSRIYYDIDKFKIFQLVYESFVELQPMFLKSKYMIKDKYSPQSDTLMFKLLETCRTTYSHELFQLIYDMTSTNELFRLFIHKWLKDMYIYEESLGSLIDISNAHNPHVITKTYQLMLYIYHSICSSINTEHINTTFYINVLNIMWRHLTRYISSITSLHMTIPSLLLTSTTTAITNLSSSIHAMNAILNMKGNPIIFELHKKFISINIRYMAGFVKKFNDKTSIADITSFIDMLPNMIFIIKYYRHFKNTKDMKFILDSYIKYATSSNYYLCKYDNLGIVSDDTIVKADDKYKIYSYPHTVYEIVTCIQFMYPRVKITKKTYMFLVNYYIYVVKNLSHWTHSEQDYIIEVLTDLLLKYSRNRVKITCKCHEKNKLFVHSLIDQLSTINKEIKVTLEALSEYKKSYTIDNIGQILYNRHSISARRNILNLILRHLYDYEFSKIYYSDMIIYNLINTLNDSLYTFTSKNLKKYYVKFPRETRRIAKYFMNNTYGILEALNSIYKHIIDYDVSSNRIFSDDFDLFNRSFIKNIIIDNMYFKPELIEDMRPIYDKDIPKLKYLKPLTYKKIDLDMYPSIKYLSELKPLVETHNKILHSEPNDSSNITKYLDPIMGTPITNPIALPDCDEVMDRSVLEEMLMYNNINPFTQKTIYLSDVIEYNKTDKAKQTIEQFMKK